MIATLTHTDFELLNTPSFTLEQANAPITLRLVTVKPYPANLGRSRQAFALLFCAATNDYLPQGTYTLTHPQMGRLELFLVPVGRSDEGLLLEAVFN